jgi:hypothetical protein
MTGSHLGVTEHMSASERARLWEKDHEGNLHCRTGD